MVAITPVNDDDNDQSQNAQEKSQPPPKRISLTSMACALLGFGCGAWAFYKTQQVTGPMFEPIMAACTNHANGSGDTRTSMEDFVNATGYHAYDPHAGLQIGNGFVCMITQFLLMLQQQEPVGVIMFGLTVSTALPAGIMIALEAGRSGNRGLLLYPTLVGLLIQVLGVSVVFPALWVPCHCFWGDLDGLVSIKRANLSTLLAFPGLFWTSFAILMFLVLDADDSMWTLCAGIVGGPIICFPLLLLWNAGPPTQNLLTVEEIRETGRATARAYGAVGMVAVVGYIYLLTTAIMAYFDLGLEVGLKTFWDDVSWTSSKAHPAVVFMTVDAVILYVGLLCAIGHKSLSAVGEAIAMTLFFGPGGACAMALAGLALTNDGLQAAKDVREADAKKHH